MTTSWDEARGKQVSKVIESLIGADAWKAVLYLSPTEVVRATRRIYRAKKKPDPKRIEVLISIGRPNYLEREFIKMCKKSSEPFPVAKVRLKFRKYAKAK